MTVDKHPALSASLHLKLDISMLATTPTASELHTRHTHTVVSRITQRVFFIIHCFAVLYFSCAPSLQAQTLDQDSSQPHTLNPVQDQSDSLGPRYGVFAHYAHNIHSADFQRMVGTLSCCSSFTGGSAGGAHLGLLSEFPLSETQLLVFRLDYLKHAFSMLTPEPTRIIVGSSVQDGVFDHHLEGSFTSLGLEPFLAWRVESSWTLNLGARVAYTTTSSYEQWEQLSQPSGIGTFMNADGSDSRRRRRNEFSGAITKLNVQWAAVAGISYELPLNRKKSWLLSPELMYHFALNNVSSDLEWSAYALTLGVALKYCPNAKKIITRVPYNELDTHRIPLIADSAAEVLVLGLPQTILDSTESSDEIRIRSGVRRRDTLFVYSKPDILRVSTRANGIDAAGQEQASAQLRTEEFLTTEMTPLLPYVFFDHSSSAIPSRYQLSAASRETVLSDIERLQSNRMNVYYQLLNILGMRMQQNPRAVVTLTGCTDNVDVEERNLGLAKARALAVKDYLTTSWSIPEDRFRIESRVLPSISSNSTTQDGAAENRRVEISCNDFSIVSPVLHRDTIRSSNPPTVRFHLSAEATRGIGSWKMEVKQQGRILKSWKGQGAPPGTVDWPLNNEQGSGPLSSDQLEVSLVVSDSLGKEESAQTRVAVEMLTIRKKRLERRGDKEIAHFGVNLFAIRHSDVSALDRQVLAIVKHNIQANSSINVYGFTDRTGDASYNRTLALSRAKSVAQELAPFKINSIDLKNEAPVYNNDLPEGRFYSRTVEIEAETPVQY